MAIQGGSPGDAWEDTQRPPWVKIMLGPHWQIPTERIKEEDTSHLPAPPGWEDGSPSRTHKVSHHLRNTLWGSIQGRHLAEVNQWSVTWGPCLPWSPSWSLSLGADTHARYRRGSWPVIWAFMENCKVWVEWQACHVDMPEWWEELVAIPNVGDYRKLAQKICGSFEIPRVRCEAIKVTNDYSVPPAPKCVERKLFLPALDSRLPCQDYCKKQPQKTLPYTQALQYWAERANLPCPGEMHHLVKCVLGSRWAMMPFTTFSDCAFLEKAKPDHGAPKAEVEGPTQPSTPPAVPAGEVAIPTTPISCASQWAGHLNYSTSYGNWWTSCRNCSTSDNQQPKGTKGHECPNWTEIHPSTQWPLWGMSP